MTVTYSEISSELPITFFEIVCKAKGNILSSNDTIWTEDKKWKKKMFQSFYIKKRGWVNHPVWSQGLFSMSLLYSAWRYFNYPGVVSHTRGPACIQNTIGVHCAGSVCRYGPLNKFACEDFRISRRSGGHHRNLMKLLCVYSTYLQCVRTYYVWFFFTIMI